MKRNISFLVALLFSTQAFAMTNLEKVTAISKELANMQHVLEEAQYKQKADGVRLVISLVAAGYLAKINTQRWAEYSLFKNTPAYAAIRGQVSLQTFLTYAVAGGLGTYGAVSGYQLVVSLDEVPALKEGIIEKRKELEAAKKLLQSLE